MTATPHDAQPPETPIEGQPTGRATPLGDDPTGRAELLVEQLEDRVLMSSDAAAAMAPPEMAAPAPAAYVGSQQPGEGTAGGPSGSGGSPVIESRAPLGEAVDAAADATAELAHGEGESRGAAGGTPGNPQAPSHNEPKEPAEIAEIKSELPETVEPLTEHGEKHEPSDPSAEHEADGSDETRGNARTRSEPAAALLSAAPLANVDARNEATGSPASRSNLHQDLGEGAVETKLEVVAEVDLASLRQPSVAERAADSSSSIASESQPPVAPDQPGQHAAALGQARIAEQSSLGSDQRFATSATRNGSADISSTALAEQAEVPQAHDAVFDRVASQGVADAVQADAVQANAVQAAASGLGEGDAAAQGAAAISSK